jgi:hypothetical protein
MNAGDAKRRRKHRGERGHGETSAPNFGIGMSEHVRCSWLARP